MKLIVIDERIVGTTTPDDPNGYELIDPPPEWTGGLEDVAFDPSTRTASLHSRPRLVVTAIDADPAWGLAVSADLSDVTVLAGATVTISAELRAPDSETVLPVNATFRMPIRARDGRELVVLVGLQQGIATVDIPLRASGAWRADESTINSGLPAEQRMRFAGVTAYVIEH